MDTIKKAIQDLERMCSFHHVDLIYKGHGHYQLKGPLLVNYYPGSKKRTAYVAGTTGGRKNVTPDQAVKMCFKDPTNQCKKAKRSGSYVKQKRFLWSVRKIRACHWCKVKLTMKPGLLNTATLEHIIPLGIGGLNHRMNMTLACGKCNKERGSDMPELTG